MKQYTTPDQTAKLIELGFKPPMWRVARKFDDQPPRKIITSFGVLMTASYEDVYAYSIGELIEMLPLNRIEFDIRTYVDTTGGLFYDHELIDALFKACVKLKEESVI